MLILIDFNTYVSEETYFEHGKVCEFVALVSEISKVNMQQTFPDVQYLFQKKFRKLRPFFPLQRRDWFLNQAVRRNNVIVVFLQNVL